MVKDARSDTKLINRFIAFLLFFALFLSGLSFATPTYSGAGTLVYATAAVANVTVTPPTHAANNILLLTIEVKNVSADNIALQGANTNWQLLTSISTAAQTWYFYWDRCTGGAEGTTDIKQLGTAAIIGAKIYNFNGSIATEGIPFQVIGQPASAGAVALLPLPSITTFSNNSLIIAAAMDGNTNPASCTVAGVSPTAYTTVYSELTAIGTCLGYATQTASATTGQVNLTWSTATTGNSAGVVLSLISPITFTVENTNPQNNSWDNIGLNYVNVSGSELLYNCSLWENNTIIQTKDVANASITAFMGIFSHGYYQWNVSCNVWNITNTSTTWNINLDFQAPTTTASATIANGSAYTFGTYMLTANTTTNLTCDDGVGAGHAGCNQTLYCIDTLNTCTPNLVYSTPLTISAPNTSYIRYASNDKYMIPPNLETTNSGYVVLVGGSGGTTTNIYGADPLLCSYPGFVPAAAPTVLITCRPIDNSTGLPITGATINCQAWDTAINTIKQASSTMVERAGRYYTWALTMNNVPNNDCDWINCTTTMNGLLVGYAGTVCREQTELFTLTEQGELANINTTITNVNTTVNNMPASIWSYGGRTLTTTEFLTVLEQERLINASNITIDSSLIADAVWTNGNRTLNTTEFLTLIEQEQLTNASNTSLIWEYSGRNASITNLPDNYLNATQQEQLYNASNINTTTNYYLDNATLNLTFDTTAIMSQVNASLVQTANMQAAQQEQISMDTIFYAAFVLIAIVMGIIALMYGRTILWLLSGALFVGLGILLLPMSLIVCLCCIGVGFYLWARIFVM